MNRNPIPRVIASSCDRGTLTQVPKIPASPGTKRSSRANSAETADRKVFL